MAGAPRRAGRTAHPPHAGGRRGGCPAQNGAADSLVFCGGCAARPRGAFRAFLRAGEDCDGDYGAPRDFDYEQDAAEIVSSFQQLYGLDLLGADGGMHWWRFRALLTGCFCTDCALSAKVRLRKMNPSKADAATQEAIVRVQLDTRESAEERRMAALVSERLKQGLAFDDLLAR